MHNTIKKAMGFQDGYGETLDALWDSLTGMKRNLGNVVLRGTQNVQTELHEYMEDIVEVFGEAAETFGEFSVRVDR